MHHRAERLCDAQTIQGGDPRRGRCEVPEPVVEEQYEKRVTLPLSWSTSVQYTIANAIRKLIHRKLATSLEMESDTVAHLTSSPFLDTLISRSDSQDPATLNMIRGCAAAGSSGLMARECVLQTSLIMASGGPCSGWLERCRIRSRCRLQPHAETAATCAIRSTTRLL